MRGLGGAIVIDLPGDSDVVPRWPGSPQDQALCLADALKDEQQEVWLAWPGHPGGACAVELSFHPHGLFSARDARLRVVVETQQTDASVDTSAFREVQAEERLLQLPPGRGYLAAHAPREVPVSPSRPDPAFACVLLGEAEAEASVFTVQTALSLRGALPLVCVAPGDPPAVRADGLAFVPHAEVTTAWSIAVRAAILLHMDTAGTSGACSPAGLTVGHWGVPLLALVDRPGTAAAARVQEGQTGFLRADAGALCALLPSALALDPRLVRRRSESAWGRRASLRLRLAAWRRLAEGRA